MQITETDEVTYNYLFSEPEGESMIITMEDEDDGLLAEFEQTGAQTA